jgi:hypothetical protein
MIYRISFFACVTICFGLGCYGDAVVHVAGQVQNNKGGAIEGAKVTVVPDRAVYPKSLPYEGTTKADGTFSAMLTLQPKAKGKTKAELTVRAAGYKDYKHEYGKGLSFNETIVLRTITPQAD